MDQACGGYISTSVSSPKAETELDDEVKAYFEVLVERYVDEGMSKEDAYRAARVKFEAPEQVKQKVRNERIGARLDATLQDVCFAARMFRKNPGFAVVVVCSLAIGIGADSAIYSSALGRTLLLLFCGSAVGLLLCEFATHVLSQIVYLATPHDPLVLVGVIATMGLLGLLATWIPARHALAIERPDCSGKSEAAERSMPHTCCFNSRTGRRFEFRAIPWLLV